MRSSVARLALAAITLSALVGSDPGLAAAQLKLKSPFGSSPKGRLYGLDVTSVPDVVFVLDVSRAPEPPGPPSVGEGIGEMAKGEAINLAQRKLVEKGGEIGLAAAGPAGLIVKTALSQGKGDPLERARDAVADAIEGLADGQRFGVVVIAAGVHSWRQGLAVADKGLRKEAAGFVEDVAPQPTVQWAVLTGGAVGLLDGLEAAFAMDPGTMIVVGGAPGAPEAEILERVSALNADGRVILFAAAIGGESSGESFLRRLAEDNGGRLLNPAD